MTRVTVQSLPLGLAQKGTQCTANQWNTVHLQRSMCRSVCESCTAASTVMLWTASLLCMYEGTSLCGGRKKMRPTRHLSSYSTTVDLRWFSLFVGHRQNWEGRQRWRTVVTCPLLRYTVLPRYNTVRPFHPTRVLGYPLLLEQVFDSKQSKLLVQG